MANVRRTVTGSFSASSTPPVAAMTSGTSPAASADWRTVRTPSRARPSLPCVTIPITRPSSGHSFPSWERAGEAWTAGSPAGDVGPGSPSPAATRSHSTGSMRASTPSIRSLTACS